MDIIELDRKKGITIQIPERRDRDILRLERHSHRLRANWKSLLSISWYAWQFDALFLIRLCQLRLLVYR